MKTLVALRHLAFEDLGLLESTLIARGWRIRYYDIGVDELWKIDLTQVDLLAILGGPIGAEEDNSYPFLQEELELIRARLAMKRPMLGICLGAQLIARAMGARVRPMGYKEIGFAPITLTPEGERSALIEIASQQVLHWHGDQFDLPAGVPSLASTPKCANQAFQIENHTMAWQFHLEVDVTRIEQWLIGHAAELNQERIDLNKMRAIAIREQNGLRETLDRVMRSWLSSADFG
jgi:GMP synthase (glutamine-hydrolysing)